MSQPFHAGGAAKWNSLLPNSSLCHLGYMRTTIIKRLTELDFTHFGSLVAIAGVVPGAWRLLEDAWRETANWIKRWFISSVTIPAGDTLNRSVSSWMLENIIEPRRMRFHTARTEINRDPDPGAALKKMQRSVQYIPHWETAWFWHERRLLIVSRCLDNFRTSMTDPTYDGIGGEELTISCLGFSWIPIRQFIDTCRDFADKKSQFFVIIYNRDRYGLSWKPKFRKPLRRLETVHFDDGVKQALLADVRNYLDLRTQKLYQSRSMPYRRGYLFYGPPGTGKSSLSTAIAGEFGLDLYEVKVPSIANDGDLEQMFQEIPPRCIVLLEDVDAIWTNREQRYERPVNDSSSEHSGSTPSNVTLSGLLNVLDGVGSLEGRVVIMTTNKPELLDPALVRPGRVDFKVFLGNINKSSAEQMFLRMFEPDLLSLALVSAEGADDFDHHISMAQLRMLAADFAAEIPDDTFTPSQLQGFFQLHLHDVMQAASCIRDWIEKTRNIHAEKDFEVC